MATDTASLKISVDSRDVKNSTKDLDNLSKSSSNAENSATSLSSTLKVSLAASAALAATALYKAASAGVTFNKSMEDSAAGLSALTVATSSNISAMGKHLSITEKYNLAIAESKKTVQQLNAINAETPHSLEDTTKIYKSMYASMKNAGASNEQMIHLTKQLSIAAGSAGIEINSLLSGVDGLANGTVETASDFGRFMSSLGLTNEELKKSTNVVELLQSKLGEFKVLDTMTVAVSNFDNAWSQLAGTLTKDIFSSAKDDINTFTAFLVKANDKLSDYKANIENISDIHKIETADVAIRELSQLVAKYDDLKESGIGLFQSTENYNAELKNQEFLINSLTKKLERLQETKDVLVAKEKEPTLTYEKWLKDEEKRALKTKSNEELAKDFEKKKQEEDKKRESAKEEAAIKAIKAEENRQKKLHDIAQSQLDMIQDLSDKKIKAEEDYQERLAKIEVEKIDKFLRVFEDMKPPLQKLNEEVLEEYNIVEAMFGGAENIPQEFFDMLIVKFEEFHDKAKKNLDFSIKIDFDTEGENKSVLKIAKSMERLAEETKQYEKNLEVANGDVALIAKAESEHSKNQIAGYANISGAMSEMFDKGSKEAAAFKAIESGLAVVAGVRAIMTAGTGDPYTAIPRMAAMAAMVASTLQSAGIAFGVGGVTTSSDAFSTLEANDGTGSILGDAAAQSKSMERSLDILSEYARPEFSLLSQMNKSLISIDDKIGGFASLLIREGGFAFGEGYEGFDTGSQLTGAVGSINSFASNTQTAIVDILTLGLDKKLFGGAIGGLLNGITGSIMGGLFGKTSVKQTMTDSGIYFANTLLTTAIEDFNGAAYQTISTTVKKKSWFSSSSKTTVSTYFAGLDDELENQFSLVLSGLYETTLLAGEALDTSALDVEKSLENFVVSIGKISLKGKTGDQIQETLEAIFGEIGDDIARTAFPLLGDFQKVGEGMYETMTRVATGMEVAEYYIDRLGKGFDDIKYTDILNKQGDVGFEALSQSIIKADEAMYGFNNGVVQMIDSMSGTAEELYGLYTMFEDIRDMIELTGQDSKYLTSSMILGAGSTEELMAGMDDYFENFLSEEEQLAYKTEAMAKEFAKLDLAMPTTSDGFKDLIKGLDLTSEAGQELYGRAIVLSEGFYEVIEASEGLKSSLFDNIQNFIDSVNNTLLPKSTSVSFYEFTSSFNDMIDAIANGSSDMLDIGNTALENAQNYLDVVTATAASSYDIDFAKAMLVNKFSGVIATPDASLTTINNTLNSNNAVLVQELQALKFELNSIKDMAVTQTATQISTLSTQRAILGNVAV